MAFDTLWHRSRGALRRGFTLIELLVVCAIIVVITAVILVDNNKFGGVVLLENLTYDVALSIRQAQVYGIAVHRFGTSATAFQSGYGMHFAIASPTTYILFADLDANGIYDSGKNEIVQTTDIQQGYMIKTLCATPATSSTEVCGLSSLDILFQRPEPDAFISINGISALQNPLAIQQQARIELISPKGDLLSVLVEATGQISVQ